MSYGSVKKLILVKNRIGFKRFGLIKGLKNLTMQLLKSVVYKKVSIIFFSKKPRSIRQRDVKE